MTQKIITSLPEWCTLEECIYKMLDRGQGSSEELFSLVKIFGDERIEGIMKKWNERKEIKND